MSRRSAPGEAIRFQDLTLGYDRHPAIHHLDGAIPDGALLAVIGPNGAGKSTLLKGVVGLLKPLSGRIELGDITRRDIAYLPQIAEIDRSFPITVAEFVAMGCWRRAGILGGISRADRARVAAAITALGLAGFEARPIGTLSGGQMQRVMFARLMLQDARLILLDEPFTAVDARTTADLLAIVQRWHGEARTVVAVLHDFDLVRERFPQTLLMARQPVAWGATGEVLTQPNLDAARRMIERFDEGASVCHRHVA